MTIRIAEEVTESRGSVLCVFERSEIGRLSNGNNIERSIVVPMFELDEKVESVMLSEVSGGYLFEAKILGRWFAVAI